MRINPINARAFQEQGSVGSNVTRRVTVWGVDPGYPGGQQVTLCTDGIGKIYMVFRGSAMGNAQPEVGETWVINRALGLWTFLTRMSVSSPVVQVVTADYQMTSSNRFVVADVPTTQSYTIKFPPPQAAIQGEMYGMRNSASLGTGVVIIAPNASETISGPTSLGTNTGASFITDNTSWFCMGMTSF
jgi:hypothetical protein